jgi:tRNA A37 threonylcarbamoyladenosine synthetase subunit TsaC/SUA5/YrdC
MKDSKKMLNNQDFAQSKAKSLELLNPSRVIAFPSASSPPKPTPNHYEQARQVLKDTVLKIDGA